MGKSALLRYARSRAAQMRSLQTVGVEPEAELPFAALHQLLRPVISYIERIPDVQAAALRGALAIGPGEAENRFVIALAVLSLMSELAADGPLLCLIDDAQWLDQSSADTLAFVARRLDAEGIVMLFAARHGEGRTFPASGIVECRLRELDAHESDELLVERFGSTLAPEVRHSIRESAQGNPLALLEIPEALTSEQLAGRQPVPQPMPIGRDLEEVFLEQVHRLPAPTQMLLLVTATEGSGEAQVILSTASRLGISPSALVDAEASGLVRVEGSVLLFRHPTIRGAIYKGASLPQRELIHRELVEVLGGEANADRRAWHRAALAFYPDDELADELERTAQRAKNRSGHAAACRALSRAAELTSVSGDRPRRLSAAARAAWDAGRPDDATALIRAAGKGTDADTYAELRHVQGEVEFRCGIPLGAAKILMEGAERVAQSDPDKALQMLFDAAMCANYAGELSVMIETGRRVSKLPIKQSEPDAPFVDLLVPIVAMLEGKGTGNASHLRQALDRVADETEPRLLVWAGAAAASIGDHARDDVFLSARRIGRTQFDGRGSLGNRVGEDRVERNDAGTCRRRVAAF